MDFRVSVGYSIVGLGFIYSFGMDTAAICCFLDGVKHIFDLRIVRGYRHCNECIPLLNVGIDLNLWFFGGWFGWSSPKHTNGLVNHVHDRWDHAHQVGRIEDHVERIDVPHD